MNNNDVLGDNPCIAPTGEVKFAQRIEQKIGGGKWK